jgi:hypothetical protein
MAGIPPSADTSNIVPVNLQKVDLVFTSDLSKTMAHRKIVEVEMAWWGVYGKTTV